MRKLIYLIILTPLMTLGQEFQSSGITVGGSDSWYWRMHRIGSGDLNESLLFSSKRGTGATENAKMILRETGELNIASIKTGGYNDFYWKLYRSEAGDLNESLVFSTRGDVSENEEAMMSLSKNGFLNLSGLKTGGVSEWYWKIYRQGSGELNESLVFSSRRRITDAEQVKMVLRESGNLGIGTTSPTHKLEVNGTIRSQEIKVEASPWPDYVFEPDYELESLESVEAFIQSNGHLPEIPSAAEMEAEGLKLGEMNRLLLKKIEELTLYTIEQEKKIGDYESLVNDLIRMQKNQEGRIQELENNQK